MPPEQIFAFDASSALDFDQKDLRLIVEACDAAETNARVT